MEQSNDKVFTSDEVEVAGILLELPRLVYKSEKRRSGVYHRWGVRRKRSKASEEKFAAGSLHTVELVPSPPPPPPLSDAVGSTYETEGLSPASPLSFTPSEPDEKPPATQSSMVTENNEEHHQQRYNQPLIIDKNSLHPVRQTIPCLPTDTGKSLRLDDNVGPIDLNVPAEEAFEFNSYESWYDQSNSSKARAAEARLKRMQICRSKKGNAACKVGLGLPYR